MEYLFKGVLEALRLLVRFDPEVYSIAGLSLRLALTSTAGAVTVGLPLGVWLTLAEFPAKRAVLSVFHALMAMPTVLVGLFLYSFLSRKGVFGPWDLLFTPNAIILGQFTLATPIVAMLTHGIIQGADPRIISTARSLGASPLRARVTLIHEVRWGLLTAVMGGFGRVSSEVGVSMMLGGNIRGFTRTLPTAIALETGRGEFALGLALGLILLAVAVAVNAAVHAAAGRRASR